MNINIVNNSQKSLLVKCIADLITSNDKNIIQNANSFIMESESHYDFITMLIDIFEAENVKIFIFPKVLLSLEPTNEESGVFGV